MANEAQLKILNRLNALEARVKAFESDYVRTSLSPDSILDEYASENEKMISEYTVKETKNEDKGDIAPNQKDQS